MIKIAKQLAYKTLKQHKLCNSCDYNDDVVFRNCVCLAVTDKFKIYTQNRNNLRKYTELPFDDDAISSMNNLQK